MTISKELESTIQLAFDEARMAAAASDPRLLATDLAEYLVGKGVPFREAHEAVARFLAADGEFTAKALLACHPAFGEDVAAILDARTSVNRRSAPGGPAPEAVLAQIARAQDVLGRERSALSKHAECIQVVRNILTEEAK